MVNADSTLRLADLAVERGCYLPLLAKQRLAADKARREMESQWPYVSCEDGVECDVNTTAILPSGGNHCAN